jgi:hypothetical protein
MTPYIAQFSSTADSRPLTGLGAWLWASGSHVCIGTKPTLVPNPRITSAVPIFIRLGSSLSAASMREVQSRARDESMAPTVDA